MSRPFATTWAEFEDALDQLYGRGTGYVVRCVDRGGYPDCFFHVVCFGIPNQTPASLRTALEPIVRQILYHPETNLEYVLQTALSVQPAITLGTVDDYCAALRSNLFGGDVEIGALAQLYPNLYLRIFSPQRLDPFDPRPIPEGVEPLLIARLGNHYRAVVRLPTPELELKLKQDELNTMETSMDRDPVVVRRLQKEIMELQVHCALMPKPTLLLTSTSPTPTHASSQSNIVAFYNHKGGVGKTTSVIHIAVSLANSGRRVMVVDADTQINSTGFLMGMAKINVSSWLEKELGDSPTGVNLHHLLRRLGDDPSANVGRSTLIPIRPNLLLLPGHPELQTFETQLTVAIESPQAFAQVVRLTSVFREVVLALAKENNIEIVLVDMNPNCGIMNQNILMSCDYFVMPCAPDFYSLLAAKSLARWIPEWLRVHKNAYLNRFRMTPPRFLGVIFQNWSLTRRGNKNPADAFQTFIRRLKEIINHELCGALFRNDMVTKTVTAIPASDSSDMMLGFVRDFNMLVSVSQLTQTPVFELTSKEMYKICGYNLVGTYRTAKDDISAVYAEITDAILLRIGRPPL